jgi:hypothetical protein
MPGLVKIDRGTIVQVGSALAYAKAVVYAADHLKRRGY